MDLSMLSDPAIWASLATLAVLEIVLGIDNLIFISILASRLPEGQQAAARNLGLAAALITRLLLLASIFWISRLTQPFLEIAGFALSWRDVILLGGGLFLIGKATLEIHHHVEGEEEGAGGARATAAFGVVIAQIAILDIVFSLDSVITAVGLAEHYWVMATAIILAILVMLFAAGPVSAFVNRHPTVKVLALSFLVLIGVALVADGLHFHIPKGYIYFAIAFSVGVEAINLAARANRRRERAGT